MEWILWALYTYPTTGFILVMVSGCFIAGPVLWLMFGDHPHGFALAFRKVLWRFPNLTLCLTIVASILISMGGLIKIYGGDEYIPNPRQCEQTRIVRTDTFFSEFTFPENEFFESGPIENDDSVTTINYQVTFCRNRVGYTTAEYGPWYYDGAERIGRNGDPYTTNLRWFERKVTMKNPS